ncbi:hypothetical protein AAFF_G00216760 [Aldrovandia affinis]|uniref:Uncharacterized protein n=1 Tax=Aldrovandia affinis TaxID=143900 RepID=A0AAD7RFZ9_9TELE|nr:hypothetical protein AAFF_G00216760 [Aldrovandia affinis]
MQRTNCNMTKMGCAYPSLSLVFLRSLGLACLRLPSLAIRSLHVALGLGPLCGGDRGGVSLSLGHCLNLRLLPIHLIPFLPLFSLRFIRPLILPREEVNHGVCYLFPQLVFRFFKVSVKNIKKREKEGRRQTVLTILVNNSIPALLTMLLALWGLTMPV